MKGYIKCIILMLAISCTGQFDIPTKVTSFGTVAIDQLFRDHYGYRVMYTTAEGRVVEVRFFEDSMRLRKCVRTPEHIPPEYEEKFKFYRPGVADCNNLVVVKDLEPGTRGFAHYIKYTHSKTSCVASKIRSEYAEFHIPSDFPIAPGTGSTGGKYPVRFNIHEIK